MLLHPSGNWASSMSRAATRRLCGAERVRRLRFAPHALRSEDFASRLTIFLLTLTRQLLDAAASFGQLGLLDEQGRDAEALRSGARPPFTFRAARAPLRRLRVAANHFSSHADTAAARCCCILRATGPP